MQGRQIFRSEKDGPIPGPHVRRASCVAASTFPFFKCLHEQTKTEVEAVEGVEGVEGSCTRIAHTGSPLHWLHWLARPLCTWTRPGFPVGPVMWPACTPCKSRTHRPGQSYLAHSFLWSPPRDSPPVYSLPFLHHPFFFFFSFLLLFFLVIQSRVCAPTPSSRLPRAQPRRNSLRAFPPVASWPFLPARWSPLRLRLRILAPPRRPFLCRSQAAPSPGVAVVFRPNYTPPSNKQPTGHILY